jgi:predicted ATP-grasp superfamily ATP-dependent carboligase
MDKNPAAAPAVAVPDSALVQRAETLAARLESLAETLEHEATNA